METRQATRDLCQMLLEGKSELVWKFDVDAIMQMCMLFLVNQQLTHTHNITQQDLEEWNNLHVLHNAECSARPPLLS